MNHERCWAAKGPLAPYAQGFRAYLVEQGFTPQAVRQRLSQFGALSCWLECEGVVLAEVTEADLERFVITRAAAGRVTWVSTASVALPLEYLRAVGAVPARSGPPVAGPFADVLEAYGRYLAEERGLAASTVAAYARIARRFLTTAVPSGIARLRSRDVTAFLVAACEEISTPAAKKMVTALRLLLRYLHVGGLIDALPQAAVPGVAGRRAGMLPQGLPPAQVSCLLASCDRDTVIGRRDYAVLVLLARLGLRAGEITALTLEDLDWRHGQILVRGKADRHERLPLPVDVGQALVDYLRGHPRDGRSRGVFARMSAPAGPLSAGGVCSLVARACRRSGLPVCGPHRLRHSAATALLHQGASMPEVAEVLRHRTLQVTAVYAMPDQAALAGLTLPWPEVSDE
jgi:integrase/recombinase XerD